MERIECTGIDIRPENLSALLPNIFRKIYRCWRRTKFLPAGLPKSQPRFGADGDLIDFEEQLRKIIDSLAVILDADLEGALLRLTGDAGRDPEYQQQGVKKTRRCHHCGPV